MNPRLSIVCLALLLTACEIPGLGPDARTLQREAEGKAVGGACRQALRSIEDCYALNDKAVKTAIYAGWREMDEYMRENKLEGQRPLYGKDRAMESAQQAEAAGDKAEAKEEVVVDDKKSAGGRAAAKP